MEASFWEQYYSLAKKMKVLEEKNKALTSDLVQTRDKIRSQNEDLKEKDSHILKFQKGQEIIEQREEDFEAKLETKCVQDKFLSVDILPVEIWTVIFQEVGEPSSLTSCYKTCPYWRNILEKDSTTFLFHEVVPILANVLHIKDILKCRLISKSWKKSVDNYYQLENNLSSSFDDRTWPQSPKMKKKLKFNFYTFEDIQPLKNFMTLMKSHTSQDNPFLTNCVTFIDYCQNSEWDSYQFWTYIILTFLQKFGSHIKSCKFNFLPTYGPYLLERMLFSALKYLPNVTSLVVKYYPSHNLENDMAENYQHFLLQVEEIAEAKSPNLEFLKCLQTQDIPHWVISGFEANSISKLKVTSKYLPDSGDKINLNMKTIEQLYLAKSCHFLKLELCPLRILSIDEEVGLKDIIKISSCYRETLRVLDFSLGKLFPHEEENFSSLRLDLPYLETLRVTAFGRDFTSIDFILPLLSLQEFSIIVLGKLKVPEPIDNNSDQIIDFDYCLTFLNLSQCNIWKLLPNLQKLHLKLSSSLRCTQDECTIQYLRGGRYKVLML